mmetsp:Transcript_53565/g.160298  ORF Transcript_53565/g.160298 Transcript_53565/m.160298 type:complete len:235 (+) Transcript_53565:516-1220(+)
MIPYVVELVSRLDARVCYRNTAWCIRRYLDLPGWFDLERRPRRDAWKSRGLVDLPSLKRGYVLNGPMRVLWALILPVGEIIGELYPVVPKYSNEISEARCIYGRNPHPVKPFQLVWWAGEVTLRVGVVPRLFKANTSDINPREPFPFLFFFFFHLLLVYIIPIHDIILQLRYLLHFLHIKLHYNITRFVVLFILYFLPEGVPWLFVCGLLLLLAVTLNIQIEVLHHEVLREPIV